MGNVDAPRPCGAVSELSILHRVVSTLLKADHLLTDRDLILFTGKSSLDKNAAQNGYRRAQEEPERCGHSIRRAESHHTGV